MLLHAKVVLACRAELLAIRGAVGDQRQPISAAALGELKTFLWEPSVSPLFAVDPVTARRAAVRLRYCLTDHPDPSPVGRGQQVLMRAGGSIPRIWKGRIARSP